MNNNINSGYGSLLATAAYGKVPVTGKLFVVADDTTANRAMVQEIFTSDAEGTTRFFSTITAAIAACTANAGDVIAVAPGYTQTVTSAITLSVAGVTVVGLGNGTLRPTITGNGTIDAVNITAANVTFDNFHFAAPGTDEQTSFINVAGVAGVTIRNISGVGSTTAKNVVDCITVAAGSDNLTIENVNFFNTTVAVNSFLSLEGACTGVKVSNFIAHGDVVAGGIIDGALITDLQLDNVVIVAKGTAKAAIVLDSNPTGFARFVHAKGTITTLASNANYGNALALFEVRTAEDFSVQGAVIPVADTE